MKSFKTSFLLHDDSLEILEDLTDEEAGKLIKSISIAHKAIANQKTESVNSDSLGLNRLEWVLFKPFYNQLLRDYDSYLKTCEKNKANGLKGGRPPKKDINKPSGLNGNPKNPDKDKDKDKDKESDTIPYTEIINFLNTETDSGYKTTTEKTRTLIKARFENGFTLDDFKKVITIKSKEWINTDSQKYLRPETLFGTKFESYLNQKDFTPNQQAQQSQNTKTIDEVLNIYIAERKKNTNKDYTLGKCKEMLHWNFHKDFEKVSTRFEQEMMEQYGYDWINGRVNFDNELNEMQIVG